MNGRGGAGEMVDLVNFQEERLDDVVSNELEPRISEMVSDVLLSAGEEIIHYNHAVAPRDQTIHEVAAHEAGAAGDDYAEALALQPQRDFAHRVDAEPGGEVPVLVHGSVGLGLSQLGGNV